MVKRNKSGSFLVILGILLMSSAVFLFFLNQAEDRNAGAAANRIVQEIQSAIEEPEMLTPNQEGSPENKTDEDVDPCPSTLPAELPIKVIDGYEYIGYLSIPDIELSLPVMAQWDYERLKIAPCRQLGSSRTDDLVIAAHNYDSHFGAIKNLPIGSLLTFTDMDGVVNQYMLDKMDTITPTDVETVTNSAYPLVLYTCTKGGSSRITLFFSRGDSDS